MLNYHEIRQKKLLKGSGLEEQEKPFVFPAFVVIGSIVLASMLLMIKGCTPILGAS